MSNVVVVPAPDGPPLHELAAALPDAAWPALFDGGPDAHGFAQWDMLACDPVATLSLTGSDDPLPAPGERAWGRLASAIRAEFGDVPSDGQDEMPAVGDGADGASDLPPFRGGAVVTAAYDLGRECERLPCVLPRDADLPDLAAGIYRYALAERRSDGRRVIVGRGSEQGARAFGRRLSLAALDVRPAGGLPVAGDPVSSLSREAYLAAVADVREHIRDGDLYQVNLAQRWQLPWEGRAADLQRLLRRTSPAPFGMCLRTPRFALVSSSPELFLRRRGQQVTSCPIKGTRPRGADAASDARLRHELETDPKEVAELSMIVDLVRNDLGRSALTGSVAVELPFATDAWSTVFHRVATVTARVASELPTSTLIERAWPPASVTGTPKLAALALIEELEPVRRHLYTGATGWIDAAGDCDLSVNIRVATAVDGRLLVPFGGGITLASDPQAEYDETLHKAAGLFAALGIERDVVLGAS